MKKSTVLLIFLIYLASIVVIGFFGMKVKVYDEIKYIKTIEMSVEAESEDMYTFKNTGKDSYGNNTYSMIVNFEMAEIGTFETNIDGATVQEDKYFLAFNLIPKITYDTGDEASTVKDSIKYSVSNTYYIEKDWLELDEKGIFKCFKRGISFTITASPVSTSGVGTNAKIWVYIK